MTITVRIKKPTPSKTPYHTLEFDYESELENFLKAIARSKKPIQIQIDKDC